MIDFQTHTVDHEVINRSNHQLEVVTFSSKTGRRARNLIARRITS